MDSANINDEVFGELKKHWAWMLSLGIVMVILGVIGLGMTVLFNETVVMYFGFLLLFGSGVQLMQAFRAEAWKGRVWHVLIALVYIVGGIIAVTEPVIAGMTLALLIAWTLIVIGVLRLVMALQMRGAAGWLWTLLGGALSVVLGVMIINEWPQSGLWVIGLFVAIEILFAGWSQIMIALAAKNYTAKDAATAS
ncbi:HdeD family acid-resistance protein [Halioglobus sp. Uisw_031]|uniref:HdeD family acid-resistance protein n=1 Tax=Halioglobus sp. Uisw_031 TaxID=3230977 RepID=UPI0039E8E598